jgi:hypothetical protein
MIDEEWLKQLRFEMKNGAKIVGFLGTGDTTIVFDALWTNGTRVALRTERQNLAWHIKEIPTFLTARPSYKLEKLHEKLLRLVGEPYFEQMTGLYYRLISAMLDLLKTHGLAELMRMAQGTAMADAFPLFVRCPCLKTQASGHCFPTRPAFGTSIWGGKGD